MSRSRWVTERLAVALAALLLALGAATGCARDEPAQPIRDIALSALPPEASETLALIRAGGPFPYARDGTTFFNREGLLPKERRGYYREYTVKTPGSPDRGARRIVAGRRGELYYTHDHYRSFRRIRQ
jgi:ribonuclease T1